MRQLVLVGCDFCHRPLKDGDGIVEIVEGEFEADTGGMATHGCTDRFHPKCWNVIVESLKFYKVALLEKVPE